MKNKNGLVPITEAMTTNQKVGRIQDVDSGFWGSSIVYGQMLEILIVHPDDAVDTLLLENKEQRGALTTVYERLGTHALILSVRAPLAITKYNIANLLANVWADVIEKGP